MMLSTRKISATPVFLLAGALCVLLVVASQAAEARGGRSGGFSRSSPASSGSITSRPAVVRSTAVRHQGGNADQPRSARATGDINNPRAARNAGDIGQPRAAQSAGGVDSTQSAGDGVRVGRIAAPVTAQEMAAYKQQFNEQNKDRDRGDWDNRWHDNDDGDDERPVVPAVVVGAVVAAVAVARADDYAGFVNTVDDPAYLAEDDCSIKAMTVVDDVTYYRCSDTWYKRGYQGGSVVYIPTDPPAGY